MQKFIVVNLQVEGLHCWADCPLNDVAFLRSEHRHIFTIRCEKEVSHDNREIEIIMQKRAITKYLTEKYGEVCHFGGMSCEMIATELLQKFSLFSCEVLEDNENGAKVIR